MTKYQIARKRNCSNGAKRAAEKPVDAEILRAAERAGIDPIPALALGAARDQIEQAIAPHLVRACEFLSEEIAAIADAGDGGDNHNVIDALVAIWRVRWEVGARPAESKGDVEQTTGGAP